MKILKYFDFILESVERTKLPPIFFSDFEERIYKINSPISKRFIEIIEEPRYKREVSDYNLISCGDQIDTVKYKSSYKLYEELKDLYKKQDPLYIINNVKFNINSKIWSNRTEIKIGRFIKKIFESEFSDSEIELFVNKWKSMKDDTRFELWDNSNIPNAYKTSNYDISEQGGTLFNSCMNNKIGIVSFYKFCPTVKVLVLIGDNGILGRALIWVDSKGRTLMDRVYYSRDKDYYKFENYAIKNGWYYKNNNYGTSKDGKEVDIFSKVKIPDSSKYKEDGFPFMDTYCYVQGSWAMNYIPQNNDDYLLLHSTDGGYENNSGYLYEDPNELWNITSDTNNED